MMNDLDFICCLSQPEASVLRSAAAYFAVSQFIPVPTVIYDAWWGAGVPSESRRKAAFLSLYLLEQTEIPNPAGSGDIPAIGVTNRVWWSSFIEYLDTPPATCPKGCTRTRFP